MRMTRATMLETLNQDYMRTARAKGLKSSKVVMRHGLRNALIPIITIVAVQFGYLLSGSVIIEQIFGLPGIGWFFLQGLLDRDYPIVQIMALFMVMVFVILNFANPDMVGHTGVFDAAVAAVEAIDDATRMVVDSAIANDYTINIISDHGNADCMMNPDGSPFTAHTTALVPHLIIMNGFNGPIQDGKLGDIAPTILKILDIPIPAEMTGDVLI